jgi:hypothetical protein
VTLGILPNTSKSVRITKYYFLFFYPIIPLI